MQFGRFGAIVVSAVCGLASSALSATVPTFYILQRDTIYTQSSASVVTLTGFQFKGRATPNNGIGPIAFDGGTISFPAGSPLPTSALGPVGAELDYKSSVVDQTTFQTDYPDGSYHFHLTDSTNSLNTQDESVDSTIAAPPPSTSIPQLTTASFNALQGMDSTQPFTVNFNAFTGGNADALTFFILSDSSGHTVRSDGLQPNATQDTIPASLLQPGQQYNFSLFFANVAITADNNGEVLQDRRTIGSFTTAPEPASLALGALGFGIFTLRRRRGASSALD